jgi:hypothetical protein
LDFAFAQIPQAGRLSFFKASSFAPTNLFVMRQVCGFLKVPAHARIF